MYRLTFFEKPLTPDEVHEKVLKMMQERARQSAEAREKYNINLIPAQRPIIEKPLTSDEVNEIMQRMIQERERQKAEFLELMQEHERQNSEFLQLNTTLKK